MNLNRSESLYGQSGRPAEINHSSGVPQPEPLDCETWEGGGREPIHPDDIDENGEYLGKDMQLGQRRSTDTSDD